MEAGEVGYVDMMWMHSRDSVKGMVLVRSDVHGSDVGGSMHADQIQRKTEMVPRDSRPLTSPRTMPHFFRRVMDGLELL